MHSSSFDCVSAFNEWFIVFQYKRELVAEAAGVHFVSASQLQEKYNRSSDEDDIDSEEEEDDEEDESDDEEDDDDEYSMDSDSEEEEEEEEERSSRGQGSSSLDPTKKGIEVKLARLQLVENAVSLKLTQFSIVIQCSRCKNKSDLTSPVGRLDSLPCSKCHGEQLVTLRPAMAHQFSSVIGYLDMNGCVPVDLILSECHFAVACFGCDKEMAMQVRQ